MTALRRQGFRFLIAGGCATGADALLFGLFVAAGIDPRIGNILSYSLSAILAFGLHRHWTFGRSDDAIGGQAARFAAMVGMGVTVSTMIVWLLAPLLGPLPAKAVAIGGTLILNFCVSRWMVFRPSRDAAVDDARKRRSTR